jgi:hypothetical protein
VFLTEIDCVEKTNLTLEAMHFDKHQGSGKVVTNLKYSKEDLPSNIRPNSIMNAVLKSVCKK